MGLFDVFSSKPAENAAAARAAGYTNANTTANNAIDTGLTSANSYYDRAYAPFATLFQNNLQGANAYGDASGANGPEGYARAAASFKAMPGFTEGLNLALDQNDRRAASRGLLANGNTIADTAKLTSDYTMKNYGDFVSRLAPYLGGAQGAAAGGAGVLTGQAGVNYGAGAAKASNNYNANVGIGGANADAAMAPYGASANMWNALMGAGNLAAKFAGGFGSPKYVRAK